MATRTPAFFSELRRVLPVGEHALLPLPLEHLRELGRPRRGDPVGLRRFGVAARAAREGDHLLHVELAGQFDRLPEHRVVRLGDLLVRVNRVAVAGQRADHEPAARDGVFERLELLLALQQLGRLAVPVARIRARADLHRFEAQLLHVVERLFKRLVAEEHRENADFHSRVSSADLIRTTRTLDPGNLYLHPPLVAAAFSIAASTFWFRTPSSKFGVGTLFFGDRLEQVVHRVDERVLVADDVPSRPPVREVRMAAAVGDHDVVEALHAADRRRSGTPPARSCARG